MKKSIIVILLAFGSVSQVLACDICGCASSAFTVGMLPNGKYHIAGVRSNFRWFESQPTPDGHGYRDVSKQLFTTTDIFGRYKISKRFQVQAFVPYVYNTKVDSVSTTIQGLGDAVLFTNYVFVDNMDSLSRKVRHSGTIGVGVKAPTGEYFKLGFDEVNMLPGTGSTDFLANVNYIMQFNKFGLQNETGYTYKTENKYNFRFGNAFSALQVVYYNWEVNENLKIVPQLGANFMHNWKDRKDGKYTEDSFNGGNILNAVANVFVTYKNVGFNAQVHAPIVQNLNENLVEQKVMVRVGLNYFIKSKK